MPWDLIFYGAMALIFIGIIVASSRARRAKRGDAGGGDPVSHPGTRDHDADTGNGGGDGGGGGGGD